MNTLKTWMLMTILTVFIVLIGTLFGRGGATIALVVAVAMNGFSYFFSDQVALAMSGAKPVTEREAPTLYAAVRHLSTRAGLPMPRVLIAPSQQPNAFATGRNPKNAAVVVNQGLLDILTERELTGVLAHEMSHIRHHDILVATVAATLAGAITWLAHMLQWGLYFGMGNNRRNQNVFADLVVIILAPIAAAMIQMAISRSREYKADAGAAHLTRDPDALADALAKLGHTSRFGTSNRSAYETPSTAAAAFAHLYIVNPLRGQTLAGLFSTHPPTEERIRRLRLMRIA